MLQSAERHEPQAPDASPSPSVQGYDYQMTNAAFCMVRHKLSAIKCCSTTCHVIGARSVCDTHNGDWSGFQSPGLVQHEGTQGSSGDEEAEATAAKRTAEGSWTGRGNAEGLAQLQQQQPQPQASEVSQADRRRQLLARLRQVSSSAPTQSMNGCTQTILLCVLVADLGRHPPVQEHLEQPQ